MGLFQLNNNMTLSLNENMGPHLDTNREKFFAVFCGFNGGKFARYSFGGCVVSVELIAAETSTF
jgi:hypothetical protein